MRYDEMPEPLKTMMDGVLAQSPPPENAAILVGDEVLKPSTAKEWLDNEGVARRIGFDKVDSMSEVSTIFMGHDHSVCLNRPGQSIYFETVVRGPHRTRIHYETLHDARLGHQLAVSKVKEKTHWYTYALWYGLWPVRKSKVSKVILWLFPWLDKDSAHDIGTTAVLVPKDELMKALGKDKPL